jgi:hypothetical protein
MGDGEIVRAGPGYDRAHVDPKDLIFSVEALF